MSGPPGGYPYPYYAYGYPYPYPQQYYGYPGYPPVQPGYPGYAAQYPAGYQMPMPVQQPASMPAAPASSLPATAAVPDENAELEEFLKEVTEVDPTAIPQQTEPVVSNPEPPAIAAATATVKAADKATDVSASAASADSAAASVEPASSEPPADTAAAASTDPAQAPAPTDEKSTATAAETAAAKKAAAHSKDIQELIDSFKAPRAPKPVVVLSAADQIARLQRPGSKYFNLNPYDVLQLSYTATDVDVKKAYRKLSMLVHPDRNPGNADAAKVFDIVNTAYRALTEDERLEYAKKVVEEARQRVEDEIVKEKKKAKRKKIRFEEPDIQEFDRRVEVVMCRLFADYDLEKNKIETREAAERKRTAEELQASRDRYKAGLEEQKTWEEERDERVGTWRDFANWGKKARVPPKFKMEVKESGKK
eukprot:TRINITY_DN15366_c0_g1_i1.p1 TRINITY_DN15366_c0_g1~~TRINITY_DN15366_c0_g1_i1.p1  ORF type:complete len:422 (-),score=116.28 TRINITY_DN15366_c0_g1_i1:88-1353(-)